jgi:uncharacterized membrane protein
MATHINVRGESTMSDDAKPEEIDLADQISDMIHDLEKHFTKVKNPNETFQEQLTPLKKLALFVTEHVGTMGFFFIVLAWTVFWLCWNILAPKSLKFDPYPAFVLWLIISNILQILLMPLLLIGQNIQGMRTDIRGEHDYETDKRAEKEIKTVLLNFQKQEKLILQILDKVEEMSKAQTAGEGGSPGG